jgi:O-antigen/teichoic acid export membrane protein
LCIIASCMLPVALNFFYGAKYSVALGYISLLLVGVYLSVAVSCSTALCLLIDNRSALNMSTGILAALTSVGLNLLLLPIIGVYGSIVAYLVSISGLYGLQYFIAKKRFKNLPAFYRQALLLLVGCATISYLIRMEDNIIPSILYLLISLAMVAAVFMSLNIKNASITKF